MSVQFGGRCVYACSAIPGPELCNAALLKPAYQMSLGSWNGIVYPAFLANDGNRLNDIQAGSCVTAEHENSWWVVDLGMPMTVKYIQFTNHGDDSCTLKFLDRLPN